MVKVANRNIVDSKLGQRLPSILQEVITVMQLSKTQTVAVCFCGAAKTQSLGIPMIAAMWAHADPLTVAYIQIPVVLYTMEQVFLAQIFVYFFKWYIRRGQKGPGLDAEIQTSVDSSQTRGRVAENTGCHREGLVAKGTAAV
jgi:sodium/bile acid cotransporter 7